MQAGDQMQQRGLAATGGADDADEFSGMHLKIDVVESEQALAVLGAITQADFAEADFGDSRRNGARGAADRDRADFAAGSAGVSREARVNGSTGIGNCAGKFCTLVLIGSPFVPFPREPG